MKSKRRLQLNGTDDAYARKDAVKDAKLTVTASAESPKRQSSKPPCTNTANSGTAAEIAGSISAQKGKKPAPRLAPATITINYRLHLGQDLSQKVQHIAEKHNQPMELIMKAARNRAVARFRTLALQNDTPSIPAPKSGGQFTRLSTVFTGEMADTLNRWFDPLMLDIAKDKRKPIILDLFQQEAHAICDAAELAPRQKQRPG